MESITGIGNLLDDRFEGFSFRQVHVDAELSMLVDGDVRAELHKPERPAVAPVLDLIARFTELTRNGPRRISWLLLHRKDCEGCAYEHEYQRRIVGLHFSEYGQIHGELGLRIRIDIDPRGEKRDETQDE